MKLYTWHVIKMHVASITELLFAKKHGFCHHKMRYDYSNCISAFRVYFLSFQNICVCVCVCAVTDMTCFRYYINHSKLWCVCVFQRHRKRWIYTYSMQFAHLNWIRNQTKRRHWCEMEGVTLHLIGNINCSFCFEFETVKIKS